MTEIELNVLTRQCLKSIEKMKKEIQVWENKRNKNPTPIQWLFTKEKAKAKLVSLYLDLPEW